MLQRALVFGCAGLVASGCVWERNADKRLARLQVGMVSRQVSTAIPDKPDYVPRTTQPVEEPTELASSGVTGAVQFSMRLRPNIYLGGEAEAGPLERGGFLGGAYGIVGAEAASRRGSISAELATGRRWLRAELGAEDVPEWVLEPRVRAQLALSRQVTLGGVLGANGMPDERGWMAGIYLGVFSEPLGGP